MRKPNWGLWLLIIVAPIAVFWGVNWWKNLPPPLDGEAMIAAQAAAEGASLIGPITMVDGIIPDSWAVILLTCNPTREKLFLRICVISGAKEIVHRSKRPSGQPYYAITTPVRDNQFLESPVTGNERRAVKICDVKRKRQQIIRFRIYWQRGIEKGIKTVWVTPAMNFYNTGLQ